MATIKSYNKRLESMKSERSSFISLYRELSDYCLGYRGRFITTDRGKGYKRNTKMFNSRAQLALRTTASGMLAGISSPARPWFQLASPDEELNEYTPVKDWLHQVQTTMYQVFNSSNLYKSLHILYGDLSVFGTAPMGIYENFDNVIWTNTYSVGSYCVSSNAYGIVDTFYREYELTVDQLVREYGAENCSEQVNTLWKKGTLDTGIKIVHVIEPNDDRDENKPQAQYKKFRSVYYEYDCGNRVEDKFLKQSGFDEFPIACPRWDVNSEDAYATSSPGMMALGDSKALQLGEKSKYKALDKIARPPLMVNANLRAKMAKGGLLPDDMVFVDNIEQSIASVYGNYRPDIDAIERINQTIERRINECFYVDLFLMLSNSDRRNITATEVAEKQEEKLLVLGPVLERLHGELLKPLIDRSFDLLMKAGVLPPPPKELQGQELEVQYVSILAQAQKLVTTGGIEKVVNFAGSMAAIWPGALNKIDAQQAVDEYALSVGINPRIIRSDDAVAELEAQQARAQQAQQSMMMSQQVADVAHTASQADTEGNNGLTVMMKNAGLL